MMKSILSFSLYCLLISFHISGSDTGIEPVDIFPDLSLVFSDISVDDKTSLVIIKEKNGEVLMLEHTSDFSRIRKVGESTVVYNLMAGFRSSLLNPENNAFVAYATHLFQLFFRQTDIVKHFETMVLIPDRAFPSIPFELLITKPILSNLSVEEMPFLFRMINIRYHFRPEACLNGAESGFSERSYRFLAVAPGFLDDDHGVHILGKDRFVHEPLPGSLKEINNISKLTGAAKLIGRDATKAKFLEIASKFDVIHLATHGNPPGEEQGYFFSIGQGQGLYSSFLSVAELERSGITPYLMVLSTCGRGLSFPMEKEKRNAVTTSLEAGVTNVVFNFWDATDETSPIIMSGFYKFLGEGYNLEKALTLAKLNFLGKCERHFSHPYYWGGLSLAGAGGKVQFEKQSDGPEDHLAVLTVLCLSLLIYFVLLRQCMV